MKIQFFFQAKVIKKIQDQAQSGELQVQPEGEHKFFLDFVCKIRQFLIRVSYRKNEI